MGGRKRGAHGSARVYAILAPSARQEIAMNLAYAVIERVVVEIAARIRSGDRLRAQTLQRDRLAATGTDGGVLDLAAHEIALQVRREGQYLTR